MNLDDEDLDELVSKGRKVNGHSKPAPKDDPEIRLLQRIAKAVEHQSTRPDPTPPKIPETKAPVVNVPAPIVTVNPQKPITKWRFTLTKDSKGHTTEIIAEAIL